MKPKFSILCPSFNHENYVKHFIDSALSQTYTDFELIIVDDCSVDKNVEIIKTYTDKRIKFIQQEYNKGIDAALNKAYENSVGEYLIFIASDDILEPFALEKYLEAFEKENVDAVYTNLSVIDENNKFRTDYEDSSLPLLINRPQEIYLNHMFMFGNTLYSPGLAIKRDVMKNLYPLSLSNLIYQDYIMNVKILIHNKIFITPQKLVKYRITNTKQSASAQTAATAMRTKLETKSLLDCYLEVKDIDLLKAIFKNEIERYKIVPYSDTIKYFLGIMALLSPVKIRKIWGYQQIMEAYNEYPEILYKKYNFQFKDLLKLIDYFNNFNGIGKKRKWYQKIFSVTNSPNSRRKIMYILGLKISFKRLR